MLELEALDGVSLALARGTGPSAACLQGWVPWMEGKRVYLSGRTSRLRDLLGKPGVSRVSEGAWLQLLKDPPRASDGLVPGCLYLWRELIILEQAQYCSGARQAPLIWRNVVAA